MAHATAACTQTQLNLQAYTQSHTLTRTRPLSCSLKWADGWLSGLGLGSIMPAVLLMVAPWPRREIQGESRVNMWDKEWENAKGKQGKACLHHLHWKTFTLRQCFLFCWWVRLALCWCIIISGETSCLLAPAALLKPLSLAMKQIVSLSSHVGQKISVWLKLDSFDRQICCFFYDLSCQW